ncbi:MAG: UDP-N-acetylmuramoyl-L-alanyl-D-glutamate--2,6-diaminopimelate ligase [Clostridia bacterium]|nr:UDP-N-acetylmuramoyl-L-alanyl-D-glutamate--2,6-diaminopimelate ligase [Clostridia bacterium]
MKRLKISDYIKAMDNSGLLVSHTIADCDTNTDVECLTYDTRELTDNALFICKGAHFKEEYLDFALSNGALCYVSEKEYDKNNGIIVSDIRKAMPILASLFYDNAPSKVVSVGITGTKGKSTVTYYLRSILDLYMKANKRPPCAIISSIDTFDGVINKESHITTPEAVEFYRHFNNAYESGITHLVSEISSQALKYDRVSGVNFDIAVFTNIGTDHISPVEHKDFEDYFGSKLKIFDTCKTACINSDSDFADRIIAEAKAKTEVVTYGTKESDTVYCSSIKKCGDGFSFFVKTPVFEKEMRISMPGIFNVSNALAAIAVCHILGIDEEYVSEGLEIAKVSGRMQVYKSKDEKIAVIVDYAHNKMSFNALYNTVGIEYPGYSVVSVFGCPGCKAHLRRKDLAEEADIHSDYIVITEEDSGEEPFESIASDIEANIKKCPYAKIEDRGQALREAIFGFKADKKIILFTGKGEETRLKRGLVYEDCPTDAELAISLLDEYDKSLVATN